MASLRAMPPCHATTAKTGGVVASSVAKIARYIVLSDHNEVDISSAFHTFYSSFAGDSASPLGDTLDDVISFVKSQLIPRPESDDIPKQILRLLPGAGPETIAHIVKEKSGLMISGRLFAEIRHFCHSMRPLIAQRMRDAGFIGCADESCLSKNNALYYRCEAVETAVMATALAKLLTKHDTASLIWLHDGMYVNQEVDHATIEGALQEAATENGIRRLKVKITSCREAYEDLPVTAQAQGDPRALSIAREIQNLQHNNSTSGLTEELDPVDLDKPLARVRTTLRKSNFA